jgi:hypothetical protein
MTSLKWWSPESSGGSILSSQWVQTFVFELPPLRQAELETTLRYKVQAMLPVNTEGFAFHARVLKQGKKTFGAAFLASQAAQEVLPSPARKLRIGLPLLLPKGEGDKVLLLIATPEGISSHYYEDGVLKNSFAPIGSAEKDLRSRILAEHPEAELICLAPDPDCPLPPDLRGNEAPESLREAISRAFPLWEEPPERRSPLIAACVLAVAGLALCALSLGRAVEVKERRNGEWKTWIAKAENSLATSAEGRNDALLKAQGAPVPELFERLAKDWKEETRIVDLEWVEGKLRLTAVSRSSLDSLRQLTADPWFRAIKIGAMKARKDGNEEFTIEGGLSLDY